MKEFILREARAVFLWSLISYTLRLCLSLLDELSSLQDDLLSFTTISNETNEREQNFCFSPSPHGKCWKSVTIIRVFLTLLSILAGWFLRFLPSIKSAVGFSFASTWIFYPIRDWFGSIPNLPCRICETVMGRISLRQLAMIFPIHFLVPTLSAYSFKILLPQALAGYAIDPISYSESNRWIVDFLREIFVNTLFVVGLLVIPALLQINGIKRRGFALLALYPLYSFSVDANSNGSVFSPNMLYALRYVNAYEEVPLAQWSHVLGPMIGGIVAGRIMRKAFPDEKQL
uniref:Uncharacterized protein n=1 Tax=Skeletonema marinoi TaxID=267567 RepID=A0A7S2KJA1_9STRA|mmetsp:Transcript_13439/g.22579  ORF Transcript_13439/g.22579 Transcript_13439/m.22579 type:complete len:287 (+) Transcript_13439:94-954(+)